MQFENNFMSFDEGQRDIELPSPRLSHKGSTDIFESSFQFVEEDISNMTSKAYIQMDSD